MFENIIGQAGVVQTLAGELAEGRLPRAALFAGPPYTGKLSTALELARGLGCREGRGEWSCECPSCALHKELAHPHTVLMGARYSDVEIAASANALLRSRRPASRFLFIRAVRKLTRRFDPAVYEADDSRMKSVQGKVSQIEELLLDLPAGVALPAEKELAELTEAIAEACAQLSEFARADAIGVGQVRLLSAWSHATSESRKVAILENADRMLDSARNALLKLLEEPPEGVHLLLLTTRRSAMLPTVVSRLRPYLFAERTPAEEAEVLMKIFREQGSVRSLRGYFLAWKQINAEALAGLSRLLVEKALRPDPATDILEDLAELFASRRNQKETAASFLEELGLRFRELLRDRAAPLEVLEIWAGLVRESLMKLETYNISAPNTLETLFFRMRAAVHEAAASTQGAAAAAAGGGR